MYSLFYNLYIRVDTRKSHTHPTGVSCCLTEKILAYFCQGSCRSNYISGRNKKAGT
ncbi:hypothetical protein SB4536_2220010 [Klebsiella pneumoniae subsp. pneumoniae T69]|nr:hypothetical protein SB4536_2220010 [Klebsiella pneumoniae subsp. pneumoniae T69]